jgi:hypothetical protein
MASSSDIIPLRKAFDYLKDNLTPELLEEFVSKLYAIRDAFTGDGAGLSGGTVTDMFSVAFLSANITGFVGHRSGEGDCKINDHPFSLKKINGDSTIALDWSKNGENSKKRERFNKDMIIINLKTKQWWKKGPVKATADEKASGFYTKTIKAGIYFISHTYCKSNICLTSNNKTDTLIENVPLYKMLMQSITNNMVIELPTEVPVSNFNILNAFN